MPSGRVHNTINLISFIGLAGLGLYVQRAGLWPISLVQAAAFTVGFFAGTFLLSPDLDLAEGHVNSKRAWGALGFLWVPYGLLFSHRGLSHSWLIGPLTRLVYLGVIVGLLVGLCWFLLPGLRLPALPYTVSWLEGLPLLAGYYVSQWLHLIADGIRPDHRLGWRGR